MTTLHSNHPYFSPAEHTFFRLYEPCDFCRVSVEEDQLSKVDGYCLCEDCKNEYLEDQRNKLRIVMSKQRFDVGQLVFHATNKDKKLRIVFYEPANDKYLVEQMPDNFFIYAWRFMWIEGYLLKPLFYR